MFLWKSLRNDVIVRFLLRLAQKRAEGPKKGDADAGAAIGGRPSGKPAPLPIKRSD